MRIAKLIENWYTKSMKPKKILPYLFIIFLLLIITFLAGLRYGKHVQSIDNQIEINKKSTITITDNHISPEKKETKKTHISFLLYQNTECPIEFMYPDILNVEESSQSAVFKNTENTNHIKINCREIQEESHKEENTSTKNILFQGKEIPIKIKKQNNTETYYYFTLQHPQNNKNIDIGILSEYLSLFERTLTYNLSE